MRSESINFPFQYFLFDFKMKEVFLLLPDNPHFYDKEHEQLDVSDVHWGLFITVL